MLQQLYLLFEVVRLLLSLPPLHPSMAKKKVPGWNIYESIWLFQHQAGWPSFGYCLSYAPDCPFLSHFSNDQNQIANENSVAISHDD